MPGRDSYLQAVAVPHGFPPLLLATSSGLTFCGEAVSEGRGGGGEVSVKGAEGAVRGG